MQINSISSHSLPFKAHYINVDVGASTINGSLKLCAIDENDNIVAFIDLTHSTFSNDLWLDYAWLIWSFEYNLNDTLSNINLFFISQHTFLNSTIPLI